MCTDEYVQQGWTATFDMSSYLERALMERQGSCLAYSLPRQSFSMYSVTCTVSQGSNWFLCSTCWSVIIHIFAQSVFTHRCTKTTFCKMANIVYNYCPAFMIWNHLLNWRSVPITNFFAFNNSQLNSENRSWGKNRALEILSGQNTGEQVILGFSERG